MAKRIPQEKPEPTPIIDAEDFTRLIKKLKKEETELTETKGRMGSAVATAIEKHNLHADALRVFRKYARKSPEAAAEFMLNLTAYFEYGKLGQTDEDLVERAATAKRNRKQDGKHEPMGRGRMKIVEGRVVPIREDAEPEAATA
jgi:hypothetical protein